LEAASKLIFWTIGKYCAVIGCHSSGNMPERRFFRFPMLYKRNANSLAVTQTRQNAWVKALNRANFFASNFKNATVCDRHFVTGAFFSYDAHRGPLYSGV